MYTNIIVLSQSLGVDVCLYMCALDCSNAGFQQYYFFEPHHSCNIELCVDDSLVCTLV